VTVASQHRHHVHNQGKEDSHKHPTGIRGLFYALFVPHTHDAHDSIDDALEASVAGIRAVKITCSG
jgi:hypothetical protein